jgi:hypothetical protein
MSEDLDPIGIVDPKQDAANFDAPMGQSMEAIDRGQAQLLHHCPRVGDPNGTTVSLPNVQFLIQDRRVDDIRALPLPSL